MKNKLLKKRLGIPALGLLMLLSLVSTAGATAVLIYDWSISLTAATPKVQFIKWADESLYNTLDLPYNLYADMWLHDDNSTHGIKNSHTSALTVYLWIESISDDTKVANVTIIVLDATEVEKAKVTWEGGSLPTAKQSFSADADTAYTLEAWIKGASTVASVTVNLKMEVSES